ncbi:hypothetical protein LEP1GSC039_2847 [Leptospira santarosai str. 2000027870]|nr:hypothetical protein LEP1GSC039_2847 [Leptospira santarosai str. 2000027870]
MFRALRWILPPRSPLAMTIRTQYYILLILRFVCCCCL